MKFLLLFCIQVGTTIMLYPFLVMVNGRISFNKMILHELSFCMNSVKRTFFDFHLFHMK